MLIACCCARSRSRKVSWANSWVMARPVKLARAVRVLSAPSRSRTLERIFLAIRNATSSGMLAPRSRALDSTIWARVSKSGGSRSEEHTSELQSLMRISYAVFCLKKKPHQKKPHNTTPYHKTDNKAKAAHEQVLPLT